MQLPSCKKKKKKSGLEESTPSPAYSLHQPYPLADPIL